MELNNACEICGANIEDVYYDVNGHKICPTCGRYSVSDLHGFDIVPIEELDIVETEGTEKKVEEYTENKDILATPYGMEVDKTEPITKFIENGAAFV